MYLDQVTVVHYIQLQASFCCSKGTWSISIFLPRIGSHDKMLSTGGGGGTQIIFWQSVRPKTPTHISEFFSLKNWLDYTGFFSKFFANQDPFLRVFLPQKRLILQFFCKMGPFSLRIFLTKIEPMSKDFWWKVTHLGSTSLYA